MKTYWYLLLPFLGIGFITLLLWDGISAVTAQNAAIVPAAVCTTDTRVLTIGDSITFGDGSSHGHAYRQGLAANLRNSGHDITFVGPYTDTAYSGFVLDHGGNPGKGANFFAPKIYNWLGTYQPDVVLLHIGSNDITGNYTETDRIESILDNIDQYEIDNTTAVPVVLAQIIDRACAANDSNCLIRSAQTQQLNDNLADMMLSRSDHNNNVTLIDMENSAGLIYALEPAGDFIDNLHPNDAGYEKMAAVWTSSLTPLMPAACDLAPVTVSTPVQETAVNQPYSYTVLGTGFPAPTYTLSSAPANMGINSTSGEITWTPSAQQAGTQVVEVTTQNSIGTETHMFTISVGEPPVFTSTPVETALIETAYSYQITADGLTPITYTLLSGPDGLTVSPTGGLVTWTPAIIQTGPHPVHIQAVNADGIATQAYTVTVNAMPIITSAPITTANANVPYSYNVTADAYPNATFSLTSAPPDMAIDDQSGLLTWTPMPADAGNYTIEVEAENIAGSDSQTYDLTVYSSPLISSLPITVTSAEITYTYQVTAVGTPPITYTLKKGANGMSINEQTGEITWVPALDQIGTHNIKVQAHNTLGTDTQTFALEVTNAPVVISAPVEEANVLEVYNYALNVTGTPPFTYELSNAPDQMIISAAGVISWTPTLADKGPHTVMVRVSNAYGQQLHTYNLLVLADPDIQSSPVTLAVAGQPYSYTLELVGAKPLNYLLTEAPRGMRINRRTGLISWTPSVEDAGFHTVTLVVSNTWGMDSQTYSLKVRRAPEFTTSPVTAVPVNREYSYRVSAVGFPTPVLTMTTGPAGMTFDPNSGEITWQPPADLLGQTVMVEITAVNEQDTAYQSFTIEVAGPIFDIFLPAIIRESASGGNNQ